MNLDKFVLHMSIYGLDVYYIIYLYWTQRSEIYLWIEIFIYILFSWHFKYSIKQTTCKESSVKVYFDEVTFMESKSINWWKHICEK